MTVAYAVARLGPGTSYYETVLLQATAASLITAITACALTDKVDRHRASKECAE
ncbi:hypothetical protein [Streptomyces sp. WMMC1477]|uniref:hypothetical protein n=1 Tax=Streptomyces sp. WMMC1477 TaxID=3015155 RepID=UPI0022B62751|nr:hypothetical protein [Streptomyces sp. WMMC1477]MCZ7433185.1 hypothetical protein [Streptomyces sp. WMMC1477]